MLNQSKKRIIIIEKDEDAIKFLTQLLSTEQFEIFLFDDYNKANEQIPRLSPHCILFAQAIGQYYGYDFSRQIKLNCKTNKIPIIMLEEKLTESFTYGLMIRADKHYKKPILNDIFEEIQNVSNEYLDNCTYKIQFILSSDLQFLDLLIHYITELLKEADYPQSSIEDTTSGIYEIVANSIEWGNEFDRSLKVFVNFEILHDKLIVSIKDEGKGFECEKFLEEDYTPFEVQDDRIEHGKRLGGFGIKITQSFFDNISYNHEAREMILKKELK